jgi:hypothetical protein
MHNIYIIEYILHFKVLCKYFQVYFLRELPTVSFSSRFPSSPQTKGQNLPECNIWCSSFIHQSYTSTFSLFQALYIVCCVTVYSVNKYELQNYTLQTLTAASKVTFTFRSENMALNFLFIMISHCCATNSTDTRSNDITSDHNMQGGSN